MKFLASLALFLSLAGVALGQTDPRLEKASRLEKAGWIQVHLEGSPEEIGFQHGYLLAPEIEDALRMMKQYVRRSSGKDWNFYRATAEKMFWPRIGAEYQAEIEGIAEGLRARGKKADSLDIAALNGWIEIAWYYIPYLDAKGKQKQSKAKEYCSAFIATGSYTADGQIVIGHNAWIDYVIGQRWNIVADIVPAKGHRLFMDAFPGFIHSGDDFVITGAGLLITETTIGGFMGFNEEGIPEFARARRAAQYASTIDDFVRIMRTDNNGGYANSWLVGDIKTNEIARLDLGLKNAPVSRTYDGVLFGANYPSSEKLCREETNFNPKDRANNSNTRRVRWESLGTEFRGKIGVEEGKRFLGDHYDTFRKRTNLSCRSLCGHFDHDPKGAPEIGWGAYYPAGAVQAKVTTTELAREYRFWARMGHPCGEKFDAAAFLRKRPQYHWLAPYLRDMTPQPWALFQSSAEPPSPQSH